MDRDPAVAGRFYPRDRVTLVREVDSFLSRRGERAPAKGVIAPHAGYVFSGAIAGAVYARVEIPQRVIVLGPNHTGMGGPAALWPGGCWTLPTGDVPIDEGLTSALSRSTLVEMDTEAHLLEHSLEVQVPFLVRSRPDVALAALCLGHLRYAECEALGKVLGEAAAAAHALVVASSDMSHYISAENAKEKDQLAIDRILALDPAGLFDVVRREGITMCGIIPATVMLVAAREMGATSAELVRYGNSGEVNGDMRQVVGYAGIVVA